MPIHFILLSEHSEDKCLLTWVDHRVSIVHQNATNEINRNAVTKHINNQNTRGHKETATFHIGLISFVHWMCVRCDPNRRHWVELFVLFNLFDKVLLLTFMGIQNHYQMGRIRVKFYKVGEDPFNSKALCHYKQGIILEHVRVQLSFKV